MWPKAPDYYRLCPRYTSCPGFMQITAGLRFPYIVYCHYLQCEELLKEMNKKQKEKENEKETIMWD
jgi:hypothetical protein